MNIKSKNITAALVCGVLVAVDSPINLTMTGISAVIERLDCEADCFSSAAIVDAIHDAAVAVHRRNAPGEVYA